MSTSLRPLIGITTSRQHATWGAWDQPADLLPSRYTDSVRAAGAIPLLLPPGSIDPAGDADAVVQGLHGLVLSGGVDVDPARYGQARQAHTDHPRPERDAWEAALVRSALLHGVPLLGICRGLQVMDVELGGTLVQHLPDVVGSEVHRPVVGRYSNHWVHTDAHSRIGAILGPDAEVGGHHHQGVDVLASQLVATAWSDDGLIEAAEIPGQQWVVGVQWHPEVGGGDALFAALVLAAVAYRDGLAVPTVGAGDRT